VIGCRAELLGRSRVAAVVLWRVGACVAASCTTPGQRFPARSFVGGVVMAILPGPFMNETCERLNTDETRESLRPGGGVDWAAVVGAGRGGGGVEGAV
jgi:hypothetical protein